MCHQCISLQCTTDVVEYDAQAGWPVVCLSMMDWIIISFTFSTSPWISYTSSTSSRKYN